MITIGTLSKTYGISTRTLRYYEELGLIHSSRCPDYAYRSYQESEVVRLQQILLLRKLNIRLKEIATLLDQKNLADWLKLFDDYLMETKADMEALQKRRLTYEQVISRLKMLSQEQFQVAFLEQLLEITATKPLPFSNNYLKEEVSMKQLQQAMDHMDTLKEEQVRILYLPEMLTACSHYIGEEPELHAMRQLDSFIDQSDLMKKKPDLRILGCNNPCPKEEGETYGYEYYVTIPKGLILPEPLQEKILPGGLYAAFCIKMGDFDRWKDLYQWVETNDEYEYDKREPFGMGGALEEHLNPYLYYTGNDRKAGFKQLDLLIPIKKK